MKSFKDHLEESLAKPRIVDILRNAKFDPDYDGGGDFTDADGETFYVTYWLEKYGWKYINGGGYSAVFGNPKKPYIIKVFSQTDSGFKTWITFCMANQSNPFIPKIYGRPTPINKHLAFVRLEKLSTDIIGYDYFKALMQWSQGKYHKFPMEDHMRKPWMKVYAFLKNVGRTDIHSGNILQRGKQQPVIVDPMADYSFERKPTKFSARSKEIFKSRFDMKSEEE